MSVLREVLSREEVAIADLEQVYQKICDDPHWTRDALEALSTLDEEHVGRPLWLLRRAQDDCPLPPETVARIVEATAGARHWLVRLQVGQLLAAAGIPERVQEEAFDYLRECFADRRVIVRAWALSALYPMRHDERFAGEVKRMLAVARRDPAKSMQARLRHLTSRKAG
ncbi:MAG: hypothetical protein NVV63_11580 [Opitutus sp.]|nr:hypothetical protein [Opitutus sp.]